MTLKMSAPKIRETCRLRTPLGGAEAQALEYALTQAEQELEIANLQRDALRRALEGLVKTVGPLKGVDLNGPEVWMAMVRALNHAVAVLKSTLED